MLRFLNSNSDSKKRLSEAVKEKSTLLTQTEPLPVYKIPLEEEKIDIEGCKCFRFGNVREVNAKQQHRTIMLVGATGAGKSTLINGMMNYILGVEWIDSFRFKLVDEDQLKSQAHSRTSTVTVYKINHQDGFEVPLSLTIIDIPGTRDTRGKHRDMKIIEQLRNLFSDKSGASEIDAVCLVAQSSLTQLTPTQKSAFESFLSVLGKDVVENFWILVTFADGQLPPVLKTLKASGVPCPETEDGLPVHFKFNNSALFTDKTSSAASEDDEDESVDQMFWNIGTKSMKRFFSALKDIETKSLTLTKEGLREKKQLEIEVENLKKQVELGLSKLEEIKETQEKLREYEAEFRRNENFEFEVGVSEPVQVDVSNSGYVSLNCQICKVTCHYPCQTKFYSLIWRCAAMRYAMYCSQCPGKCYWTKHSTDKYKWDYKKVQKQRTAKELKDKHNTTGEEMTFQELMSKLEAEYKMMLNEVVKLTEKSSSSLNRLREIELKPNPLSTAKYIDLLIDGEKKKGKDGWKRRVESLMKMKEQAELMS